MNGIGGLLKTGPCLALMLYFFVSVVDCGSKTGRLYLTPEQKDILCSLNTTGLDITFCKNINSDPHIHPDFTPVMESTCDSIAKALKFQQGFCMQSKTRVFMFITYVTNACAITNSTADVSTLDLNVGSQWIFLIYDVDSVGDSVNCPNGLKDFDGTK